MSRAKLVAVGVFVLVTLGLFATALFLVGERRMLFTRHIELNTRFADLSGLQPGSPVRVAGMTAGEVRHIAVPSTPGGPFVVRFTVREDLESLVRTDSLTSIRTEGLVGGTYLAVAAGSGTAPPARAGATLPSREPVGVADLLEQVSRTVTLITEAIVDVRADLEVAIAAVTDAAQRADAVVAEVGEDVAAIAESSRRITNDAAAIVADMRAGRGTVGKLLTEDELYREATSIMAESRRIAEDVRAVVAETRRAVETLNAGEGPTQTMIAELRETVTVARAALENLEENTEALKRNWFFRGFFRDRGYYDLDDLSPAAYRGGLLKRGDREDLRIWLRGDLLFESTPDEGLVLSDEGRARLDSAMATFLRYPLEGPLIVEGYATGPAGEAFVAARRRAGIARDYLVSRFELNPRTVGIVPLVEPGDRGPDGQPWDGVALAFFVKRDVLRKTGASEARPHGSGAAGRSTGRTSGGER
ncbi:MAG TPA: MlaD family protein [Vicinamibacterales bacterium]|nr:MlaD family protein [Vicinamibacterales bacterium]